MNKFSYMHKVMRNEKLRVMIFPVIMSVLLLMIGLDNLHLAQRSSKSVIYTYTDSFVKGQIGSGYGSASTYRVSFNDLEPGDIILGGWPNCAYGRFSHAGLYIGNNQVLEGYVDYGLSLQELNHYLEYSELCLLRVEADSELKKQAVAYAIAQQGKMFYPVAFKNGERYWNCSKIIWQAYMLQGINLDIINDLWMAPESFTESPSVKILFKKGS